METRTCYSKHLVYSKCGAELQLEQIRAMLPEYRPESCMGECEMELTVAYPVDISTMVSTSTADSSIPSTSCFQKLLEPPEPDLKQARPQEFISTLSDLQSTFSKKLASEEDIFQLANKENMCRVKKDTYGFTPSSSCAGKPEPSTFDSTTVGTKLNFSDDSFLNVSSHPSQLLQSEDSFSTKRICSSNKHLRGFDISSGLETKARAFMLSKQQDENEFPMTEIEAPSKEMTLNNRKVLQPLESSCSDHQCYNQTGDESSFLPYHDVSNVSTRRSQHPYNQTGDESSFLPYHDASNVSTRRSQHPYNQTGDESSFLPYHDASNVSTRRSQHIYNQTGDESSFLPYHDASNVSTRRSQHPYNQTGDESSFLPYHDASNVSIKPQQPCNQTTEASSLLPYHCTSLRSTAGSVQSCAPIPLRPTGMMPQAVKEKKLVQLSSVLPDDQCARLCGSDHLCIGASKCNTMQEESALVPSIPVTQSDLHKNPGIPEYSNVHAGPAVGTEGLLDMTTQFTQFDIPHPKTFKSVSTPVHNETFKSVSKRSEQVPILDLSVITCADHSKLPEQQFVPFFKQDQLTPITEESSGKSKTNTLSSRSHLTSSSNSNTSGNEQECLVSCNPFLAETVNRMLNCLGGFPTENVDTIIEAIPAIKDKGNLVLNTFVFGNVVLLRSGHFSSHYLAKQDGVSYMLQVHHCPLEWEVTSLYHLHKRLGRMGLQHSADYFQLYTKVYYYPRQNVFLTLSPYHPIGSIQELIEKCARLKVTFPPLVVQYLCVEMLSIVACLHKAGIIHTALTPAHFLLCKRCGDEDWSLKLIDFKCCVDTLQFHEDQLFVGCPSPISSFFLCPEMRGDRQWKWQADYYALAAIIVCLISDETVQPSSSTHNISSELHSLKRHFDCPLWRDLLLQLVNAKSVLDLEHLKLPLQQSLLVSKMKVKMNFLMMKLNCVS